jgi:hypothetical protein
MKAGAFYGCFNSGLGGFFPLAMDLCAWALFDELVCLPFMGGECGTTLKEFCLSTLCHIYENLYLLLKVQECRFMSSLRCRAIVLSMGDWILIHLPFRFPDPTGR